MKIQSQGGDSLIVSTPQNQVAFNPSAAPSGAVDFVALSKPGSNTSFEAKKVFNTPGEFEVSGVLANAFFTEGQQNVVYKIVLDEISLVHFGNLTEVPEAAFFEKLGENVDVITLVMSEAFDHKKAKSLIDKIDPRMVILVGDNTQFPKMIENAGAKVAEESELKISKGALSDDKTDVLILNS